MRWLSTYQTIFRNLTKVRRALRCAGQWLMPFVLVCSEGVCQMNPPEGECHQCDDVILVLLEKDGRGG